MILPSWPSQYPFSCNPNPAAWGKHSASPVACRHHCPSGNSMIPSVPGQLGDFSRRSKDCCQAQGCTLKDRSSGSSTRPQHSKIVSHFTSPLQTSPGEFSQIQTWIRGRWLFPSRGRSRAQQPCVPQLQASEIPVLGKELPVPVNAPRPASACPHGSLGDVPATSCPSVAHAMPDTG